MMPRDGMMARSVQTRPASRKRKPLETVEGIAIGYRAADDQVITIRETMQAGVYGGQTSAPTMLDRIAAAHPQDITAELVSVGVELAEIGWLAKLRATAKTCGYEQRSSPSRGEPSNEEAAAHVRWNQAMAAIGLASVRTVVRGVVLCDQPTTQIGLLKVGLIAVARHWGRK